MPLKRYLRTDDAGVTGITAAVLAARQRRGRKPILRRPPKPASIKGLQRSYLSDLLKITGAMQDAVDAQVIPYLTAMLSSATIAPKRDEAVRADGFIEDLDRAMKLARLTYARRYTRQEIDQIARRQGNKISDFNAKEFDRQFGAVLGVTIPRSEPFLGERISAFTAENVSLISSIEDQFFPRIEQTIIRGVTSGKLTDDITEEIQKAYDVSDSRAALIARDQTSKFNGALTETRQVGVGVTQYVWSTSLDERVRESHANKEGDVFAWADPPSDTGHPGQDFQCRCVALPLFDDSQVE